jgi:hypothetical protein
MIQSIQPMQPVSVRHHHESCSPFIPVDFEKRYLLLALTIRHASFHQRRGDNMNSSKTQIEGSSSAHAPGEEAASTRDRPRDVHGD